MNDFQNDGTVPLSGDEMFAGSKHNTPQKRKKNGTNLVHATPSKKPKKSSRKKMVSVVSEEEDDDDMSINLTDD